MKQLSQNWYLSVRRARSEIRDVRGGIVTSHGLFLIMNIRHSPRGVTGRRIESYNRSPQENYFWYSERWYKGVSYQPFSSLSRSSIPKRAIICTANPRSMDLCSLIRGDKRCWECGIGCWSVGGQSLRLCVFAFVCGERRGRNDDDRGERFRRFMEGRCVSCYFVGFPCLLWMHSVS